MNKLKKIKLCILLLTIESALSFTSTPPSQEINLLEEIEKVNNAQDILSMLERYGIRGVTPENISSVATIVIFQVKQAMQEAKLGNEKKAQELIHAIKKNIALLRTTGRSTHHNPFVKLLNQNVIDLVTAKVMWEIYSIKEQQHTAITHQETVALEQAVEQATEQITEQAAEDANAKEQAAQEARRKKEESLRAKEEARRAKEEARRAKEEARQEARRIKEEARLAKEEARRAKAEKKDAE